MLQNVVNSTPYLRTTREFPFDDIRQLAFEVNKSYLDIASAVNNRVIGIFPTSRPAVTGETWFFDRNLKQQSFRQVYTIGTITELTTSINHGIPASDVTYFTKCYGSYTDGTNWYGLYFAGMTTIVDQITFYITPTQIIINKSNTSPALTKAIIVLEWISQS
jgi:hypothetical protein